MNIAKISIIMGVYNAENTIMEAIDSIINQTYKNWELIICDDSSSDNTKEILTIYQCRYPEKIKIIYNFKNMGLSFCLNKCLSIAEGKFVARMDADDISAPNRFEKQVQFLNENQNVDLVGTAMRRFDSNGLKNLLPAVKNPSKYTLKSQIPFNHATIMTYRRVYDELNGYTVSERTRRSQDYDLWFRFYAKGFNGDNIMDPLYFVREDENAIRRRTFKVRYNAFKTTIIGYKMLDFPKIWLINPFFNFIFKSIVPFKVIDYVRRYQSTK